MHVFLCGLGGEANRLHVAVAFDAERRHGLARFCDPVGDALRPAVLDADHDHGGDVGVGAGADQRSEMQIEVGAELQPSVGMRDGERALDVVRHRVACGVREVVHGQDDDVVAHADAAVLALVALESRVFQVDRHECLAYQRLVLMLCTCACSPTRIGATARPMSTPYLITVAPAFTPSTTTPPTESFSSWTTKWIMKDPETPLQRQSRLPA